MWRQKRTKKSRRTAGGKERRKMQTTRDKMVRLMDALIEVAVRIADDKNAKPEELSILPALADSVVRITGYAVIEKNN